MADLITLTIDGKQVSVPKGTTIMEAANKVAVEIPHFCYHKRLSVAGNCRMCLVEVEGAPKPVASCAWPAAEGMVVNTTSKMTQEARKGTMEFLLINHPLDCPICDQAGECHLQDISVAYGADKSHYAEAKRAVKDKDLGAKIKTVMTRCIHCTRCVRFATEVAGVEEFGATFRGENTKIGTYVEHALQSELAGNMIDLCPVGALTSKPYAYTARPWELKHTESIDVLDAVGSHTRVDSRAGKVMRILPREFDAVNEEWMTDAARFSYDALNTNRLQSPMLKARGGQKTVGWAEAMAAVAAAVKGVRKEKIAAIAGDIHGAEDLLAFKQFAENVLETAHVDARPVGAEVAYTARAHRFCNTSLLQMEQADAILLVGSNPRLEAPLLNLRLRRAVQKGAKVGLVGAVADLGYAHDHLGDDIEALEKLLDAKSAFAKAFKAAKKPLVIVGEKAVMRRSDTLAWFNLLGEICEKFKVVTADWNGFNTLFQSPSHIAAIDMGAVPGEGGKTTAEIIKAAAAEEVDVLLVYGEVALPEAAVKNVKKIIYVGTHHTELAKAAHIALPVAAFTEKEGLYPNVEGRVQAAHAAVLPPLHAKEDWKVFRALSEHMGKKLPFDTLEQLRDLVKAQSPRYKTLNELHKFKWQNPQGKGKALKKVLEVPVEAYYLNSAFLQQSATMHLCQADVVAAKNNLVRQAG